jgi:hypothetical protein
MRLTGAGPFHPKGHPSAEPPSTPISLSLLRRAKMTAYEVCGLLPGLVGLFPPASFVHALSNTLVKVSRATTEPNIESTNKRV